MKKGWGERKGIFFSRKMLVLHPSWTKFAMDHRSRHGLARALSSELYEKFFAELSRATNERCNKRRTTNTPYDCVNKPDFSQRLDNFNSRVHGDTR